MNEVTALNKSAITPEFVVAKLAEAVSEFEDIYVVVLRKDGHYANFISGSAQGMIVAGQTLTEDGLSHLSKVNRFTRKR